MGKNHRLDRMSEEIKKSIGNLLVNGIKDPRLNERIITVSGVDLSPDGSYATCYVMPLVLSGEDRDLVCDEVLRGLESAKGVFRFRIGKDIKMRNVPELTFKIDSSMEYGRHIDEILETITYSASEETGEEVKDV